MLKLPPNGASVASARKNVEGLLVFLFHVCCGSWWKFLINHLHVYRICTWLVCWSYRSIQYLEIQTKYGIIFKLGQISQWCFKSKQFISGKRDRKWKKDVKCLRLLHITKRDPNTSVNFYLISTVIKRSDKKIDLWYSLQIQGKTN